MTIQHVTPLIYKKKSPLTNKLILALSLPFILSNAHATPPKEVIKSCHLNKAINLNIQLTELNGLIEYKDVHGCGYRQRYEVEIDGAYFYTDHCKDGQYFIAGARKIKLKDSVNKSAALEIRPLGLTSLANWYKIQFRNKSYICMESALGENGWAAAVPQYYVVENVFNKDKPLQSYFYFFDKKFIDKVHDRGWTNG